VSGEQQTQYRFRTLFPPTGIISTAPRRGFLLPLEELDATAGMVMSDNGYDLRVVVGLTLVVDVEFLKQEKYSLQQIFKKKHSPQ
jgi:hypothetical protein